MRTPGRASSHPWPLRGSLRPERSAQRRDARTGQEMVLTFDAAFEVRAGAQRNPKGGRERVVESESRVAEARAAFLPQVDLNFLYTLPREFPSIRIPAGIFGPNELSFSAAFTRQNIMRLDVVHRSMSADAFAKRTATATQMSESQMHHERGEQTLKLQGESQAFYAPS